MQCPTLLPHVHVVDLPVPVLRLADATVGEGIASVIWIHAEIEVVAGVSHGKLQEKNKGVIKQPFNNKTRLRKLSGKSTLFKLKGPDSQQKSLCFSVRAGNKL